MKSKANVVLKVLKILPWVSHILSLHLDPAREVDILFPNNWASLLMINLCFIPETGTQKYLRPPAGRQVAT